MNTAAKLEPSNRHENDNEGNERERQQLSTIEKENKKLG